MTGFAKAQHVGSLLRPTELLRARRDHANGTIDQNALAAIEEKSIQEAIAVQRDSGIGIYTDGEYLRSDFMSQLTDHTDGFVEQAPTLDWNSDDGNQTDDSILKLVGGQLRHRDRFTEREARSLAGLLPSGGYKISIPEVTNFVVANWQQGISDTRYPRRDDIIDDLTTVLQTEAEHLTRDGVGHVQIDAPCFTSFVNPKLLPLFESEGIDPAALLQRCIDADKRIIDTLHAAGTTVGMHICRGNYRGQYFNEGHYDGIAAALFGQLPVDQWLLEYDTERAGSFAPLAQVPAGVDVVLGLVTTKSGTLENEAALAHRVEEASAQVSLENLAISPQCGFASEEQGNPLSWDEQRRKLDLVVSAAQRIWG